MKTQKKIICSYCGVKEVAYFRDIYPHPSWCPKSDRLKVCRECYFKIEREQQPEIDEDIMREREDRGEFDEKPT